MSEVRLSSRATVWYRWGMPAVAVVIGFKLATVVRALPSTTMGVLWGVCGVAILAQIVRRAVLVPDVCEATRSRYTKWGGTSPSR